jgi:hypothetical protein
MMRTTDAMLARIERFAFPRGGIVVEKVARGYSLYSGRTGEPVARLRPTGEDDKVRIHWWNGKRWAAPGPFGVPTMTLQRALDFIASEPAFWIHA